jgi:hypothetical protein
MLPVLAIHIFSGQQKTIKLHQLAEFTIKHAVENCTKVNLKLSSVNSVISSPQAKKYN